MNATQTTSTGTDVGVEYEYLTYCFGVLLIASEILPLLKNKSNGLVHTIICVLRGSSCVTGKLAEQIEKSQIKEAKIPAV